jgi:roadblock/LC7 domain-containing protein
MSIHRKSIVYALLVVLLLSQSSAWALPALAQGQAGTTLSAEKTAIGFWERTIEYDWSLDKSVMPDNIEIKPGESGSVEYWLDATRSIASQSDKIGVRGQVCVTNGGDRTTENLKIVDRVQYKTGAGPFQDLGGATQTIVPAAQLGPGESQCYDYEIEFTPVAGATYRNVVKVTITNHSGHLGDEFGPEPKADFSLPGSPTLIEIDAEADLSDLEFCPAGFSCTPSDSGPWHFTDSGSVHFSKEIDNVSAPCDEYFNLDNTATLTENDSGQQRSDSARVVIFSGECPGACTRTIGYWKTHAGFHGNNADRVTPLLPIWLGTPAGVRSVQVISAPQAVNLLSMSGDASNGINKLYAQLLGTKLNIASGADGSAVAATIAAADAFLATKNAADWGSLTKAQKQTVLGWMTTLDNYNSGLIGPGHCS